MADLLTPGRRGLMAHQTSGTRLLFGDVMFLIGIDVINYCSDEHLLPGPSNRSGGRVQPDGAPGRTLADSARVGSDTPTSLSGSFP